MADITQTLKLDDIASGDSIIHNLNGPVKLISAIIIIVFTVFSQQIIVPIIMEIFLLLILYLSKVSIKDAFKRIALLLPFGGAIIIFQPFIHPGNVLWAYSWIQITDTGLNWAIIRKTDYITYSHRNFIFYKSDAGNCSIIQKIKNAKRVSYDFKYYSKIFICIY